MINDLKPTRVNEVKLVNYLTTLETVPKFGPSNIQDAVSGIQEWFQEFRNGLSPTVYRSAKRNVRKCKLTSQKI